MTSTQKQKFIEASKNPDYKQFEGYVCLGYGDANDTLIRQLSVEFEDIYSLNEWASPPQFISGYNGDSYKLYYLPKEKWNEIFREVEDDTPKAYRFDSQEELDNLVLKYGEGYFGYIPTIYREFRHGEDVKGFLLKDNTPCWSSGPYGLNANHKIITYKEAMNITEKELTMEEKVNYAKSFIGKRIKSRFNTKLYGLVDRVEVHLNSDIIANNTTQQAIDFFNKEFNKSGFVITLRGNWDGGQSILYAISDDDVQLAPPNTVKINGYESEDKGDYFQFGCAKISKDLLKIAESLMLTTFEDDNRKVESVKIGAGEFTLKDIQTLLSQSYERA